MRSDGIKHYFDNDGYAKDVSRKVRAVLKAKGQSGKPLSANPPYGYKKSEDDKNRWVIDEPAAEVVKRIFKMCIEGRGPRQIARALNSEGVTTPSIRSRGAGLAHWDHRSISDILERLEYVGHTVNFKTTKKSYKLQRGKVYSLTSNSKQKYQKICAYTSNRRSYLFYLHLEDTVDFDSRIESPWYGICFRVHPFFKRVVSPLAGRWSFWLCQKRQRG